MSVPRICPCIYPKRITDVESKILPIALSFRVPCVDMSQVPHPPTTKFPQGAGLVYKLFAAVVVLLLGNQAISIYFETLWFGSVGYESVYWYRLAMQWGTFAIFAVATGGSLVMLLSFVSPPQRRKSIRTRNRRGRLWSIPPPEFFRRMAVAVALVFGILFGLAYSINWSVYALFLNRPAPSTTVVDPILGQDLNFYLFVLPTLESLSSWFVSISVLTLLAALLVAALDKSNRFRGLSLGLALTFLALASRAYLYRFHLLYQEHPLISGVTYVDDNAVIPGLWFLTGAPARWRRSQRL